MDHCCSLCDATRDFLLTWYMALDLIFLFTVWICFGIKLKDLRLEIVNVQSGTPNSLFQWYNCLEDIKIAHDIRISLK